LPKLSISIDHDNFNSTSPCPCPQENLFDQSKAATTSTASGQANKRVLKSSSAIDLSLKISPSYSCKSAVSTLRNQAMVLGERQQEGEEHVKNNFKYAANECSLESDISKNMNSGGNGSSTASSREPSPSRDSHGPLITNLKPP